MNNIAYIIHIIICVVHMIVSRHYKCHMRSMEVKTSKTEY